MVLVDGRLMHFTVRMKFDGLRYISNTWFRVPSAIAIGWTCCIMGAAEDTEHTLIFIINEPPNAGRFIVGIMVFISAEQP